jgi:hypothetical protein
MKGPVVLVILSYCACFSFAFAATVKCEATRIIDAQFNEVFSFDSPNWAHIEVVGVSNFSGTFPMKNDTWSYDLQLCDSLNVLNGDLRFQQQTDLFGFSHGHLTRFEALDKVIRQTPIIKPATPTAKEENDGNHADALAPNPHVHDIVKEFTMYYENGDVGAPCSQSMPRGAHVHIWCAYDAKSCDGIPGAQTPGVPFGGNISNGFALCGIYYNTSFGVCKGLELHLLSNSCPGGRFVPSGTSARVGPQVSTSAMVAIVLASIVGLILIVVFFSCWGYRSSVLGRKGVTAIPGYDLIPQRGSRIMIDSDSTVGVSSSGSAKSSYGAL